MTLHAAVVTYVALVLLHDSRNVQHASGPCEQGRISLTVTVKLKSYTILITFTALFKYQELRQVHCALAMFVLRDEGGFVLFPNRNISQVKVIYRLQSVKVTLKI